jgi:acyl carrier protein
LERVHAEAEKILGKEQIDRTMPLMEQGADELDLVEIVMAVEEVFNVEIPDEAIGGKSDGANMLSVQTLAEIVSSQRAR